MPNYEILKSALWDINAELWGKILNNDISAELWNKNVSDLWNII